MVDANSQAYHGEVRPLLLGLGWFPEPPGGGLDRYLQGLVTALSRDGGASPRAVVVSSSARPADGVIQGGRQSDHLVLRLWRFSRAARDAARDAEVIDAHFAMYALPCLLWPQVRRLPLVVHFHGPWAQESQAIGGDRRVRLLAKRAIERLVYRRAHRVVVLSYAFKRLLVERYGVDPWLVSVIRPGVELDRFQPGDQDRARRLLGLPQTAWVAVTARRLVPRTGVDLLLDAWAQQPADEDARLLVVGEGPERAELTRRATTMGSGHQVRFLGRVHDEHLVACYQAADLAVVPSRALEGFGLVVLEALACGVPVLVSNVGGLAEAVTGLDPACVVDSADPAALAQQLGRADRPGRQRASAAECRRHAETFSWRAAAAAHRGVYATAAGQGARSVDLLRIVYLDHTAKPSGGEVALLRLLPAIPGVAPHVILGQDGPLARRMQLAGVSVEVRPLPSSVGDVRKDRVTRLSPSAIATTIGHTLRLALRLRRLRPDLVHTNSLKSALYGGVAARLAGVPVIWHLRDRIAPDYLPRPAVWAVRALCQVLPQAVIVDSEVVAHTLPDLGSRLFVIPSPIPDFGRDSDPAGRASGPLRVAMVGRLAPWKGQTIFVEAFAQAFGDGDEEAVIVGGALFGEEGYVDELHDRVAELGLTDRVALTGHLDDVSATLASADVLVHASVIPEPFGLIVLEGMAAGVPVVAAGAGGPAEVITEGVDGLLYRPGSAGQLAERLVQLRDDPALRERLAKAGRASARRYRPERIGPEVAAAYTSILSRPRRRHPDPPPS